MGKRLTTSREKNLIGFRTEDSRTPRPLAIGSVAAMSVMPAAHEKAPPRASSEAFRGRRDDVRILCLSYVCPRGAVEGSIPFCIAAI